MGRASVPGCPERAKNLCRLSSTLPGFKSFSLTSVELQMLTNSCVKLQTVHSIPLTINKEGGQPLLGDFGDW